MNKALGIGIVVLVVTAGAAAVLWFQGTPKPEATVSPSPTPLPAALESALTPSPATAESRFSAAFATPKKSAHYENNTPTHGVVLPAPPPEVALDFNFDLTSPSTISTTKDGVEYGRGNTIIDSSKLAMRRAMDQAAPDGVYTVSYRACWPDRSCHDGQFQFAIDRQSASAFLDSTGVQQVTIAMKDIAFVPAQVRIRRGTRVTWQNEDPVEHFVNTDPHPQHTGYAALNSRGLAQGATYSYTFDTPGAYSYHCSAHADVMHGTILVE